MRSGFVNDDEVERTGSIPPGRGHWVRKYMRTMKVGQTLKVLRMEWEWYNKTPNVIVLQENKKTKRRFQFSLAADHSGWFIKRVE